MNFAVPVDFRAKNKESEKERKVLRSCKRTEKVVVIEGDGEANCVQGKLLTGWERGLEELKIGGQAEMNC